MMITTIAQADQIKMTDDRITTLPNLVAYTKKPGVKVFAYVALTDDDAITVEVKKGDFLAQISQWEDDGFNAKNSRVSIVDGHIFFG